MTTSTRRSILALGAAGAGLTAGAALAAASTKAARPPAVVGATFLRSLDPDPAALARFIELNWFEMDRIAKEQGLMTDYALFTAPELSPDWNVLVTVGYPQAEGYAAIAPAFEEIRRAHVVKPVDGKILRELGVIVRSVNISPRASG